MEVARHRDDLLHIWGHSLRRLTGANTLDARHRWMYGDNPAGVTQTWMGVHKESTDVIGCGSMVPRTLHPGALHKPSLQAGILSDLAVVQQHRTAGPALKILRAVVKGSFAGGADALYGSPNPKSSPIFKRLRFKCIGEARTFMKPLRAETHVHKRMPVEPVAKAAAWAIDGAHRAADWATNLNRVRRFDTEIATHADDSFHRLWNRARPRWITGEKSASYLNWRYAQFATSPNRFLRVVAPDGTLIGYVVYYVTDDNAVMVADLFCDYCRDTRLVLLAFSDRMRAEGFATICVDYLGNDFFRDALVDCHFLERGTGRPFFVLPAKGTNMPALNDPQRWFMLEGDLDI